MGLNAYLASNIKYILFKYENVPNILKMKKKDIGTMGVCSPCSDFFMNNQKRYQNIDNKRRALFSKLYITH